MKSLCMGLISNHKIKDLNLSRNSINDTGIEVLIKPLSGPSCMIETLDLSDNDICDKGGMLIAKWLQTNRSLIRLNLKNNLINVGGSKAIRNTLFNRNSYNLEHLNLSLNPIDIKLGQELEDMIYGKIPF